MMGYGMDGWWFGMGLGWLVPLLLIALVVWGLSALSRRGGEGGSTAGESALDILKQRYARGEISREEYQQMREDLRD